VRRRFARRAYAYLLQRSVPGTVGKVYESTIPLRDALDHGAILCYEMDGQSLTLELGWPLRLIDPSLYGYKQVKCIGELRLTTEFRAGWWEVEAGYDPAGTIRGGRFSKVQRLNSTQ
jgi:DMSO/TMAO reductase YedYZ molybdopterin-dependent catalytic subunit